MFHLFFLLNQQLITRANTRHRKNLRLWYFQVSVFSSTTRHELEKTDTLHNSQNRVYLKTGYSTMNQWIFRLQSNGDIFYDLYYFSFSENACLLLTVL